MLIIIAFYLFLIVFLVRYFTKNDRGPKEPLSALLIAAGFGLLGLVLSYFLEIWLVPDEPINGLLLGQYTNNTQALLAFLLVGVIEEFAKAIPLAIFIWKKPYFNEVADGVIYFGIAGLSFGIVEDLLYANKFGADIGLLRGVVAPFLHVGFSALIGWAIARRKVFKKGTLLIVVMLLMAVVLHGFYNYFLGIQKAVAILLSLSISLGVNIMVFVLYSASKKTDQSSGMSASGTNNFCRNCGKPNPKHTLYCVHCGKKT